MKINLKAKFALYFAIAIAFVLFIVAISIVQIRRQQIETELIDRDQIISSRIAGDFTQHLADYYYFQYETFSDLIKKQLTIVDDLLYFEIVNTEGKILFDSHELSEGKYDKIEDRVTSDMATLSKITKDSITHEFVMYQGERALQLTTPYIDRYGRHLSTVIFIFSLKDIKTATDETIRSFLFLFGIFLAIGIAITIVFVNEITKPIFQLKRGAEEIGKGNFDVTVNVKTGDELEALAFAFNQMVNDVKESRKKLEEYSKNLEQQVADRTRELNLRVEDLERLQKIAINRELKMIELKKEIESLHKGT